MSFVDYLSVTGILSDAGVIVLFGFRLALGSLDW